MAFRDELFAKIGADSEEGETDPFKLIQNGDIEYTNGNVGKANTLYTSAVKNGMTKAQKYAEQKQYRSAAEAYYLTSLGYLKLGQKDEAEKLYNTVGEQLMEAANMYINTYEEYSHGVTCAALGGLIYVLLKDYDKAKSVYENTLQSIEKKSAEGKIQIGKESLVQTVWVVGYVLQALQEVSHESLQEAQRLIASQIRPSLSKMKLSGIEPLLNQVVDDVLSHFQDQIKLPSMLISSELPKDIVVNQIFEVKIDLMNTGEGVASNARVELELPSELELVDGDTVKEYQTFEPEQHEQLVLHLRHQTSTPADIKVKLGGKITYFNMLKNQQVQYFGPYEIEINAESKKDKLGREIKAEVEKIEGQQSLRIHEDYPSEFTTMLSNVQKTIVEEVQRKLDNEEYENVPAYIESLQVLRSALSDYFSPDGSKTPEVLGALEKDKENYAESKIQEAIEVKSKEFEETLASERTKFEAEKEAALAAQREETAKEIEELKAEHQKVLDAQKQELKESFEKEKNELIEAHKIQLDEMESKMKDEIDQNTALMDRKLNAKLSEQEEMLREQFNKQLSESNEKNAETVNELRKQFEEEKVHAVEETENRLKSEYEGKIKELTNEYEEKLRLQKEQLIQENELKISQLQSKHEKELLTLKEDYEMKLKEHSST